jgi:hypothetical protein
MTGEDAMIRSLLVAVALVLSLPSIGHAAGYYGFTVSASSTDPFVNNPPHPGSGLRTLYVWSLDACNPTGNEGAGWYAAEFRISSAGWTITDFVPAAGIYDVGPETDGSGKDLMMAAPCVTSAQVIGRLRVDADGPGALTFGPSSPPSNVAVAVHCDTAPAAFAWPEFIRFVGYASQDAGANQDVGDGCLTSDPVAATPRTWGSVKASYR